MTYRTTGKENSLKDKQGYLPATTILLIYYAPELHFVHHGDTGMKALEVLTCELVDGVFIRQGPTPLGEQEDDILRRERRQELRIDKRIFRGPDIFDSLIVRILTKMLFSIGCKARPRWVGGYSGAFRSGKPYE